MEKGSIPTDDGFLSNIKSEEADEIRRTDPLAAKYLRRVIGAKEMIHGTERWGLWLVDADPSDIRQSPVLKERIGAVKAFRLASTKEVTRRDAGRAHEFQEIRQPQTRYLGVPRVSSELRDYVPVELVDPEVIATDGLTIIPDANLVTFAFLSSRPFNVWNKAISGRLESRVRVSNSITYNNFPFPSLNDDKKAAIESGAAAVIEARASFAENTLADLYDSDAMPTALRKAHEVLDKRVLEAFGLKSTAGDSQILERLFDLYSQAVDGLLYKAPTKRSRSK